MSAASPQGVFFRDTRFLSRFELWVNGQQFEPLASTPLDPFSAEHPAASLTLPLFALVIVLLIIGVLIGGIAAWLRQSKWRRTARRLEREMADLHIEIEGLKRTAGIPMTGVNVPAAPERLQLRPPTL